MTRSGRPYGPLSRAAELLVKRPNRSRERSMADTWGYGTAWRFGQQSTSSGSRLAKLRRAFNAGIFVRVAQAAFSASPRAIDAGIR